MTLSGKSLKKWRKDHFLLIDDVEGRVIDHSTILLKPLCHPSIWLEDWQSVSKQ